MMRRLFFIVLTLTALFATACGTIATPEPSSIEQTEIALLEAEESAQQAEEDAETEGEEDTEVVD